MSFVKYQISAFQFSLHHLNNRQSITSEATDCLLIPLALASNTLVYLSRFRAHHNMLTFPRFSARENGRWSRGVATCVTQASRGAAN